MGVYKNGIATFGGSSIEEAAEIIRKQTAELHAAAAYNEKANADVSRLERIVRTLQPQLHEKLYSPLWNLVSAEQRNQPVPNGLWLATSFALIAGGIAMLIF